MAQGTFHTSLVDEPTSSRLWRDVGQHKADPSRVLFGSDFPEASLQASIDWVVGLSRRLGLARGHEDAILHGNAARLFKA